MTRRTVLGGMLAAWGLGATQGAAAAESRTLRIRNKNGVPGMGAMIATSDGFEMLEAAGVRRLGGSDPVSKQDLWHLGSNGKAITASLYARLVEAGKAQWGATLNNLFGDIKIDPAFKTVTIEELFNHTSGIADTTLIGPVWLISAQTDQRPLPVQRAEAVQTVLTQSPGGKRGQFAYANANYILAGAAMERLMGASWEDLMRTHVFGPLDMPSAGFGAPKGPNAPTGHRASWFGFGGLQPVPPEDFADNPPALGPAGTMHMNLEDYAKFLRVFFAGYTGGFLSADSIARLTKPADNNDRSYALGWITQKTLPFEKSAWLAHEGSNTMWHAFTAVSAARRRAVVAVCNTHQGGGAKAAQELGFDLIKGLA